MIEIAYVLDHNRNETELDKKSEECDEDVPRHRQGQWTRRLESCEHHQSHSQYMAPWYDGSNHLTMFTELQCSLRHAPGPGLTVSVIK